MVNEVKNSPEDILSSVDSEHEGMVVEGRNRAKRKRVEASGNKVIFFMVVFIVLISVTGIGWFFYPSIITVFQTSEQSPSIEAGTSTVTETPSSNRQQREIDTDRDGLSDIQEQGLGLSITDPDTDGDGLSDRDEVEIYNSNPRSPDSDGDGFSDGDEVRAGYDPNGEGSLKNIDVAAESTS